MNFDEVVQAIKPFGRYQQRNYLLTCLLGIPASIHTMVTVFILATPEHRYHSATSMFLFAYVFQRFGKTRYWWTVQHIYPLKLADISPVCKYKPLVENYIQHPFSFGKRTSSRKTSHTYCRCAIPGLDNDTWQSQGPEHDELVRQVIPFDTQTKTLSQCTLFKYRSLQTPDDARNDTAGCSQWVYNKAVFDLTVISELNLVCGDKNLITLANSILMGGLLCGSLILGALSDIIGRKKTMLIGVVGQFCVALATGFISNYIAFIALRFLTTLFGIGFYLAAFVAAMELVGPDKRALAGVVIGFFWGVGLFLILLLAYFLPNWHHLQIAASCVNLFFFSYYWLIPESPRWLVSRGRRQEASVIVRHAALVNKVVVSEKVVSLQDLQNDGPQEKVWHMFNSPRLLFRCLIIFLNWCVVSMVYYGLGLNVGSLSGGLYLNFLYASIAETLSYVLCFALINRLGRRVLHCLTMLLGGVACVAIIFPVIYGTESLSWLTITLSMVGKFSVSAAFTIIYIFSAELFPTIVRNSALGASSFSARVGGIVSPYVADISSFVRNDFGMALPYAIFGVLAIAAGLASLWLPETLNKKLPETIDEARNFGRDKTSKESCKQKDINSNEPKAEEIHEVWTRL